MNRINYTSALTIFLGLIISLTVNAQPLQSLEEIEHVAYMYGMSEAQARYDNPQIVMEPLDKRLRLEECAGELDAFSNSHNNGLGNRTIGIKCHTPVAWTVYVPIKVKVFLPVVVAARPLAAKQIITKADLRIQQHDISTIRQGYLKNTDQAVGQQLKYSVAQGIVLNPKSLVIQKMVRRGEQITLIAKAGGMEVRMSGTALSDATHGQRIQVKNVSSKRIVEGIVDAPGIVRIMM
ncbi:MAG: flagella basal body P-ring formation protein FlgA [Gammaproteobacteria bacterium]|nr:MAG: flagella basal body P-ring formation protein FlgA [Gammaproteobacteria bacterium]RKZ95867.1 MAG: flagella basal body P-ring formation protein FlgA [Gammaproteobacteria bacterium]RKZ96579.1 MAG: flagella basal body P-ring formation protein FlgA [Gammaproteobacteria bacterium]